MTADLSKSDTPADLLLNGFHNDSIGHNGDKTPHQVSNSTVSITTFLKMVLIFPRFVFFDAHAVSECNKERVRTVISIDILPAA